MTRLSEYILPQMNNHFLYKYLSLLVLLNVLINLYYITVTMYYIRQIFSVSVQQGRVIINWRKDHFTL